MKKMYYFVINGKVLADDKDDANTILKNLMNKRSIEAFKIESVMTEAK